jgi:hypothetical protein
MTSGTQGSKTRVSKDGCTATVSIPISFLHRSGRKQILSPPGAAPWSPAPRVDSALIKAVVRAHRWRVMLESGEYASSAELAKAQKVNDSYLLKPLPAEWDRQRSVLNIPQWPTPVERSPSRQN